MKIVLLLFSLLLLASPLDAQSYLRGAMRLGVNGGINVGGEEATAKYANYTPHPYGTLTFEYYPVSYIALTASLMAGTLEAEIEGRAQFPAYGDQLIAGYNAKYYGLAVGGNFLLPPLFGSMPFVRPRIGYLAHQTRVDGDRGFEERISGSALTYGFGAGIEYPITRNLDLTFAYDLVLTSSDDLDGLRSGDRNDALSVFTLGINVLIRPGSTLSPRSPAGAHAAASPPVPAADRRTRTPDAGNPDHRSPVSEITDEGDPADEGGALHGIVIDRAAEPLAERLPSTGSAVGPQLATQLRIQALTRLRDLADDPSLLTLRVRQTGTDRMRLKCSVEMLRDDETLYEGTADLTLGGAEALFDAADLIDVETLIARNDGSSPLPRGNYLVRVSTVAWDHDLGSLSKAKFLNVDLRPIFGAKEEEARDLILQQAADVSLEGNQQLLVNFFRAPAEATALPRSEHDAPASSRDALRLAPPALTGAPRERYLAEAVEHSFGEGLRLQSIAGSIGRARNLNLVLSEIFFAMDSDLLHEEARLLLDNAARLLNQHPELFAEIRGYANDAGDESGNRLLAERRAQRVLEYLVRQKLSAYRITAGAAATQPPPARIGEDVRRDRRVEIVLKNRGM